MAVFGAAAHADDSEPVQTAVAANGAAIENRVALPPALRKFERKMSGDMREIESEFATWLDQNYMTGNWFGWRNRLNDWGIIPSATYVPDILGNPIGGRSTRCATCTTSASIWCSI